MNSIIHGPIFAGALFAGMLLFLEAGYRIGVRRLARDPQGARQGIGAVDGAVFGLLGLLVAFTFSGAASRFDERRKLIIEEVNNIGTVWLRVDLLESADQSVMREWLRNYLDSRIETYRKLPDIEAAEAEIARSAQVQGMIWKHAVAACSAKNDAAVTSLVLAASNAMFDNLVTRIEMARIHPPPVIFTLLFGLGLGCALLAGYGMAGSQTRSWAHILGFTGVLALSVYVIIEIEYPRLGVIRLDNADRPLVELRQTMDR